MLRKGEWIGPWRLGGISLELSLVDDGRGGAVVRQLLRQLPFPRKWAAAAMAGKMKEPGCTHCKWGRKYLDIGLPQ